MNLQEKKKILHADIVVTHACNCHCTFCIPKLYPNGNYNKTWCNEDNDPYLGNLP